MTIQANLLNTISEYPYPLLFTSVGGAHLYGYWSPTSDYTIRGVHILPLEDVVGLHSPHDKIELTRPFPANGHCLDWSTYDIKRFFRRLLKHDGQALEQLFSPLILRATAEHERLADIGRTCLTRNHAQYYMGEMESQRTKLSRAARQPIGSLLGLYRVMLTGIHLMRSGEMVLNLPHLNEEFKLSYLNELIEANQQGHADDALKHSDWNFHDSECERLETRFMEAHESSSLPEYADIENELNDLLVHLRINGPGDPVQANMSDTEIPMPQAWFQPEAVDVEPIDEETTITVRAARPKRVEICHPTLADADEFLNLMRESENLHYPWVAPPTTPEAFEHYINRISTPDHEGFVVRKPDGGPIVGVININNIVRGALQSGFLGYYVGNPYAGKGHMSEGMELVIDYAFNELMLHRLEANIQPENERSLSLVKRCGFHREGFSPKYLRIDERWRDHERWAILACE